MFTTDNSVNHRELPVTSFKLSSGVPFRRMESGTKAIGSGFRLTLRKAEGTMISAGYIKGSGVPLMVAEPALQPIEIIVPSAVPGFHPKGVPCGGTPQGVPAPGMGFKDDSERTQRGDGNGEC